MEFVRKFHEDWAYTAIAINIFAGLWTLLGMRTSLLRKKYFYWPAYAGWIAILLQVALGIYMFSEGTYSAPAQHYFYGFIFLMMIGGLFAYMRSLGSKKALVFGCVALFFAAMAIRAIFAVG
jgi:hypothetical protein